MKKYFILFIFIQAFIQLLAYPVNIGFKKIQIVTDCDQVLEDTFQKKCENFEARKPRFNFYHLTKEIIDPKIKKKFSFKNDKRLITSNYIKCYYKSHFDRGHLAPDASFDYNLTLLKTTYLSSNIVPEKPHINRVLIVKIENKFRKLIDEYGEAYILTGAHYTFNDEYKFMPDNKKYDCGYYPDYIYKVIYIPKNNYLKGYIITQKGRGKIIELNDKQLQKTLNENKIKLLIQKNQKGDRLWKIKLKELKVNWTL